jgi:hypothetical protein
MILSAVRQIVQKAKSERGAAAVEFSALLPLLFIILSIIIYTIFWFIEFSKFQMFWNVLTDLLFKYGEFIDADRVENLIGEYNASSNFFTITLRSDCSGNGDVPFLFERDKISCHNEGDLVVIIAEIEARLGAITDTVKVGDFNFTKTIAAPR